MAAFVVVDVDNKIIVQTIEDPLPAGSNILGKIGIDSANTGGLATEAKLEAVRALVASLDGKDFATQTTLNAGLSAILTELGQKTEPGDNQKTTNAAGSQVDGHSSTLGSTSDADTTSTVIGRLKKIVGLLAGGLPAALTGSGSLKTAVVEAIVAGTNEIGKVAQGTAAALAGAWAVRVTDLTNVMPTMDAAARAGFFKRTDGTNVAPTGDAVARAIFYKLTDGTNGPAAVKPGNTAAVEADAAVVVQLSPNQASIPVGGLPPGSTPGLIFGRVLYGGSAGVLTAVRGTTYTEQLTNFTGSIKSNNAADTSAGTGARTIKITYFDQTGAGPLTETKALNGTTPVNLTNTDHCFIEKIEVVTVGSGLGNAGTISLFTGAAGTGTLVGTIGFGNIVSTAGDNRTLWGHHYVASGLSCSLFNLYAGTTGNQIATVFVRSADVLTANTPESQIGDFQTVPSGGAPTARSIANPIVVTGFKRITMYIVSQGSNTNFYASIDFGEG